VADGVRLRAGAELGGVGAGGMWASQQKMNFDRIPQTPVKKASSEPKPAARI
jgi:hypothetical protein